MKTYAIFEEVQRGTDFVRKYVGFAESEHNLSRLQGVYNQAPYGSNFYVKFSADKAALLAVRDMDDAQKCHVDEHGNVNF